MTLHRRAAVTTLLGLTLLTACSEIPQMTPPESLAPATGTTFASPTSSTTTKAKAECNALTLAQVRALGGFRSTPQLTESLGNVGGCAWTDGIIRVQLQDQRAGEWFARSKGLDGALEWLGTTPAPSESAMIAQARADVEAGRPVADAQACRVYAALNRDIPSDIPVTSVPPVVPPVPPAGGLAPTSATTAAPVAPQAKPKVVALPEKSKALALLAQQCINGRYTSLLVAGPDLKVTTAQQKLALTLLAAVSSRPLT